MNSIRKLFSEQINYPRQLVMHEISVAHVLPNGFQTS